MLKSNRTSTNYIILLEIPYNVLDLKSTVIFIELKCDKIDPYVAYFVRTVFTSTMQLQQQHKLLLRIGRYQASTA